MRRILIWRKVTPGNELDIFHKTDYQKFYDQVQDMFDGNCPNWGNKLWFQGLYSEIDTEENQISFRQDETVDEINDNYDLIIYPMANFFAPGYVHAMQELSQVFKKVKIPVYIIACGAQADSYEKLDELVEQIGEPAKQFISSIYSTGGEFALRGNFTKEFFNQLGFPTAVVTGCPSLYQMGANFQVIHHEQESNLRKIVVNGKINYFEDILKRFPESVYIDQDLYFKPLFQPNYIKRHTSRTFLHQAAVFEHLYGRSAAQLLAEDRIKMIPDMDRWYAFLKYHSFQYSIGTRIHGNIMSILCGIPSTVIAIDTRTKEMAEFFDIPYYDLTTQKRKRAFRAEELFEFYRQADYGSFNRSFPKKFKRYEAFLQEKGIVTHVNCKNDFFHHACYENVQEPGINKQDFGEYACRLKKSSVLISVLAEAVQLKNKLFSQR